MGASTTAVLWLDCLGKRGLCFLYSSSGIQFLVQPDLVYRRDDVEVYRNVGQGNEFPEPLFAILNFAKINDAPMQGEWVMEVDWVKHEKWQE